MKQNGLEKWILADSIRCQPFLTWSKHPGANSITVVVVEGGKKGWQNVGAEIGQRIGNWRVLAEIGRRQCSLMKSESKIGQRRFFFALLLGHHILMSIDGDKTPLSGWAARKYFKQCFLQIFPTFRLGFPSFHLHSTIFALYFVYFHFYCSSLINLM